MVRMRWPAGVHVVDRHGQTILGLGAPAADAWPAEGEATDALTGLPSRPELLRLVERELELVRRGGPPGSLAIIDLDSFKRVNDTCGHAGGDQVLAATANLIRGSLRTGDVAVRFGADEFAVLLPQTTVTDAVAVLERLMQQITQMQVPCDPRLRVSASAGVTRIAADAWSAQTILQFADRAMYAAKVRGGGRVHVARRGLFDELRAEHADLAAAATTDERTGLPNDRQFSRDLRQAQREVADGGELFGLLLADIDHFHEYNREHGMLSGHDTLREVAQGIAAAVDDGTAYRYGGEEFAVLLPGLDDVGQLERRGRLLVQAVRDLGIEHLGQRAEGIVTVTVAGAIVRRGETSDDLVERVDHALVRGKSEGRDRYVSAD